MADAGGTPVRRFAAVVLAGGPSSRMGRNKLLMEVAARPMVRHVVETVRGAVGAVTVVTGHQPERVAEALARLPVRIVWSDPEHGLGAAILAGVAASLEADPGAAVVVCAGDQPRLTEREITGLTDAFEDGDGRRVLLPVREGRGGYPVIVPAGLDAGGLDLDADGLLDRHPAHVSAFETRNPVYHSGIDTPEDYRALFAL